MIKTNLTLYLLLSLVFLESTAGAMEEDSEKKRVHTVRLSIKNATGQDNYTYDFLSNFGFRVNLAPAQYREGGTMPACMRYLKKLQVPSQKGEKFTEIQERLEEYTQYISFYCSAAFQGAQPQVLDPVELNLGWPVKLTTIHLDFHGLEEKSIMGKQHYIPGLSVQVNRSAYDILQPQSFVDFFNGNRFFSRVPSFPQETKPRTIIVSLQNNTRKNHYKFEETLNCTSYHDLQVEVVLEVAANLREFTRGEEEGLKLPPRSGCSFSEERVNPNCSLTRFISAYVSAEISSPHREYEENGKRKLFGTYELNLGEKTDINDILVKLGADTLIPDSNKFIPEILFQINGQSAELKPQKFFRLGIEYSINKAG